MAKTRKKKNKRYKGGFSMRNLASKTRKGLGKIGTGIKSHPYATGALGAAGLDYATGGRLHRGLGEGARDLYGMAGDHPYAAGALGAAGLDYATGGRLHRGLGEGARGLYGMARDHPYAAGALGTAAGAYALQRGMGGRFPHLGMPGSSFAPVLAAGGLMSGLSSGLGGMFGKFKTITSQGISAFSGLNPVALLMGKSMDLKSAASGGMSFIIKLIGIPLQGVLALVQKLPMLMMMAGGFGGMGLLAGQGYFNWMASAWKYLYNGWKSAPLVTWCETWKDGTCRCTQELFISKWDNQPVLNIVNKKGKIPSSCIMNRQCPDGQVCKKKSSFSVHGQCQDRVGGKKCIMNRQCAKGEICKKKSKFSVHGKCTGPEETPTEKAQAAASQFMKQSSNAADPPPPPPPPPETKIDVQGNLAKALQKSALSIAQKGGRLNKNLKMDLFLMVQRKNGKLNWTVEKLSRKKRKKRRTRKKRKN